MSHRAIYSTGLADDVKVSPGRHWLVKVASIARNTLTETIRQPLFAIILCVAIVLIVLSPFLTMFTLMQGTKMVKDMGLATMFLAGVLLAAFGTSNVVSEEIENHTALTVMSKPVGRFEFVLGKYLGVLGAMALSFYLMGVSLVLVVALGGFESGPEQTVNLSVVFGVGGSILLACAAGVFANYFYDRSFPSTAMLAALPCFTLCLVVFSFVHPEELKVGTFGIGVDFGVVNASLLLFLAMLILTAVALLASTRLNVVLNASVCTVVFFLGLMSPYFFGKTADGLAAKAHTGALTFGEHTLRTACAAAYAVTPNLQEFWMADVLAVEGGALPFSYVVRAGVYALCYTAALLLMAMVLFEERQLS